MSKRLSRPVERWVNEPDGSGIDAQLGELFRALPEQGALEAGSLRAVERRLETAAVRSARRRVRYWAVGFALISSLTGGALAEWGGPLLRLVGVSGGAERRVPEPPGSSRALKAAARPLAVAGAAVPKPSATRPALAATDAEPAPSLPLGQLRPTEAAPGSAAPAPSSALARESALLSLALTELRRHRDAAAALRALDRYQGEFPGGVMALEAATARVDALLLLGQRQAALDLLSRLPLEQSGRKVELLLLRAELFAEKSCARAVADFDAVLASAPLGAQAERALYGRAGCHLRLGRDAEGRADLLSYSARFPQGRFAAQVRARLAESP